VSAPTTVIPLPEFRPNPDPLGPEHAPLPWRVDDGPGPAVMVLDARGDCVCVAPYPAAGDLDSGQLRAAALERARLIVRAANAHAKLYAALRAWVDCDATRPAISSDPTWWNLVRAQGRRALAAVGV
jgi:hypothetical protein